MKYGSARRCSRSTASEGAAGSGQPGAALALRERTYRYKGAIFATVSWL